MNTLTVFFQNTYVASEKVEDKEQKLARVLVPGGILFMVSHKDQF